VVNYFLVCVQLATYADNVALPAFDRRTPLLQQSIDISCPMGSLLWAHAGTDRRGQTDRPTDSVPFRRPWSAYYVGRTDSDSNSCESLMPCSDLIVHRCRQQPNRSELSAISGQQRGYALVGPTQFTPPDTSQTGPSCLVWRAV